MRRLVGASGLALYLLLMSAGVGSGQDFGRGFEAWGRHDYEVALKEFRLLAERGDAMAMNYLMDMYLRGKGVKKDIKEAQNWLKRAAETGNAGSQYSLGRSYAEGGFGETDFNKALEWLYKAAEQRHGLAQLTLGTYFAKGEGVIQDLVVAHMWFNICAAEKGDTMCKNSRAEVEQKMTAEQIAEAQRLARECVQKQFKGC